MNQLSFLARCAHYAHYRIISKSAGATNSSQTTTFTMGLQNLSNLFGRDLAIVVHRIKSLVECVLAMGVEITLTTIGSFTMFAGTQIQYRSYLNNFQ
jgi:hypothetical protein